jgi:starch synthase
VKVLFCAAEAAPLAKTGGLADVAGALPAALRRRGVDVRIMLPLYRGIGRDWLEPVQRTRSVIDGRDIEGAIWIGTFPNGTPIYLLDAAPLYDRAGL